MVEFAALSKRRGGIVTHWGYHLVYIFVFIVFGEWCNGSTEVFEAFSRGSSPRSPANFSVGVEGHTVGSFRLARES